VHGSRSWGNLGGNLLILGRSVLFCDSRTPSTVGIWCDCPISPICLIGSVIFPSRNSPSACRSRFASTLAVLWAWVSSGAGFSKYLTTFFKKRTILGVSDEENHSARYDYLLASWLADADWLIHFVSAHHDNGTTVRLSNSSVKHTRVQPEHQEGPKTQDSK